jgi:Protein of unknown function (DUF1194)
MNLNPQFRATFRDLSLRRLARLGLTLALCLGPARLGLTACPDLALVLAIDGSGSIDASEFDLQMTGYAAAFRAPRVKAALASAGRVDVAVVLWGDDGLLKEVLPWQSLQGAQDAEALARRIAGMPRSVMGSTGIGSGISRALDLLAARGDCAGRRLINVSGDGMESMTPRARVGVTMAQARIRARDMGVTINALAITNEVADLGDWFRDKVITGPDAFVMQVTGFDTFGDAIARKLAREIALPQVADLPACVRAQSLPPCTGPATGKRATNEIRSNQTTPIFEQRS